MASAGSRINHLPYKKASLPKAYWASLVYHDIFDYPLTKDELNKWKYGKNTKAIKGQKALKFGQFYSIAGHPSIERRRARQKASLRKIKIAENGAKVLGALPFVKMVGITGALAMQNAQASSDIDLIIICSSRTLWTTRLIATFILDILKVPRRRYGLKDQKDRLCLNMWLDEEDLSWDKKDRNVYTAHEICQIVPLVNKKRTYERLIWENGWVRGFWPNAPKAPKSKPKFQDL